MFKKRCCTFPFKDRSCMKSVENLHEETEKLPSGYLYKIIYAPHGVLDDYNATYNIVCEDELITINAASELCIPLKEIWISEKWKPYAKYVIFHELREPYYRAKGFERDEAHERARKDEFTLWKDDSLWLKMNRDTEGMNGKTAEKKMKLKFLK